MDESRSKRTQRSFKGANASSENIKAYQAIRRGVPIKFTPLTGPLSVRFPMPVFDAVGTAAELIKDYGDYVSVHVVVPEETNYLLRESFLEP